MPSIETWYLREGSKAPETMMRLSSSQPYDLTLRFFGRGVTCTLCSRRLPEVAMWWLKRTCTSLPLVSTRPSFDEHSLRSLSQPQSISESVNGPAIVSSLVQGFFSEL